MNNPISLNPNHSGTQGTPRSRTDVVARCVKTVNRPGSFRDRSAGATTPRGEKLICTTCGNEVSGGHPASCNSPTQRFVTPEESAKKYRRAPRISPSIHPEVFKRQREEARKNADPAEVELL